ncbi:MAG: hypothetical protein JKY89_05165 [Immundisolibacteraceae bacterium]|nr:hypothetical protein [Immundisolibacteraceae bacterium]
MSLWQSFDGSASKKLLTTTSVQTIQRILTKPLFICLLLCGLNAPLSAATQLTIIELHHRPAEQLVPLLQPLMQSGDYLTGQNNKLLIRTDHTTLQAITKFIQELDQPLANLLITLKYGSRSHQESSAFKTEITTKNSNSNIATRTNPAPHHSSTESGLKVTTTDFDTLDRNRTQQTIRVTEGYEATFNTQQKTPLVAYQQGPFQQRYPTLAYQQANSGFAVTAYLNGNLVTLQIRPQKQQFSSTGSLQGQKIGTTLTFPLGQWIEIGSNINTVKTNDHSLLSSTNNRRTQDTSIKIRVETVDRSN